MLKIITLLYEVYRVDFPTDGSIYYACGISPIYNMYDILIIEINDKFIDIWLDKKDINIKKRLSYKNTKPIVLIKGRFDFLCSTRTYTDFSTENITLIKLIDAINKIID